VGVSDATSFTLLTHSLGYNERMQRGRAVRAVTVTLLDRHHQSKGLDCIQVDRASRSNRVLYLLPLGVCRANPRVPRSESSTVLHSLTRLGRIDPFGGTERQRVEELALSFALYYCPQRICFLELFDEHTPVLDRIRQRDLANNPNKQAAPCPCMHAKP
jgi:hypothetical protein